MKNNMAVEAEMLRMAMRQWVTGVTVVTSQFGDNRHGMTVNSFTSISLTPPLVLVSLERSTRTHALVLQSGVFGVTLLSVAQQKISECFAGRIHENEDRFYNLSTQTLISGAPFLTGGLAFLDCQVVSQYDAGTHTLFIGEVLAIDCAETNPEISLPLVYYDRAYRLMQL
jgi:flavin reductase (DIM6/NTAB) family NADH-FMN oxidoreductase RutF